MNTKIWVGIALVIAVLLAVNIFAFGFLPDYIKNGKIDNSAIINKNNNSAKNVASVVSLSTTTVTNANTNANTNTVTNAGSNSGSSTGNSVSQTAQGTVGPSQNYMASIRPTRMTRAS